MSLTTPAPPELPRAQTSTIQFHASIRRRTTGLGNDEGPGTSSTNQIDKLTSNESIKSLSNSSSSDMEYLCRICRCEEENVKVVKCPCKCKGSVGFVHLNCLKEWMLHRQGSRCEVCNTHYKLPTEHIGIRRMMRAFCSTRCAGQIIKNLLMAVSLVPLARVILHQVLICMDKLNPEENTDLTVNEVFMALGALLTSSALFFNFFEYITLRMIDVRNLLRQWWIFGDYQLVDPER